MHIPFIFFPDRLRGQLQAWQVNLLPAMSLLGALAISFIALSTGNWLGRRTELLLAAFIYGELHGQCTAYQVKGWHFKTNHL